MQIQRLSTSSFKFTSPNGKTVLVDPWLTDDPFWPEAERSPDELKQIDVIAITHAHFDHASGISEILKHNENVFVVAQYEYAILLQQRGVNNVIPLGCGATVDFQGIKFSMVGASHTSSEISENGDPSMIGMAVGYVIEFENKKKIYVSGDTGLTADMKFVVGDYHKPDISILPVIGIFMMEPEQAAYAAKMIGSKYVIPSHDFPVDISDAADPEGYKTFLERFPVQGTYKKVERFMDILKNEHPKIQGIYISIGEQVDIK